MISPKNLLLNSTRFLVSASEPLTGVSLTMFENFLTTISQTIFSPDSEDGDSSGSTTEFSRTSCRNWFDSLCLKNEGMMTPADVLVLCETINKSPNDIVFLLLAYKMGAKNCGFFLQYEWLKGMAELEIDSTEKLIQSWESLGHLIENPEMEKNVYKFAYDYTRDRDRDGNGLDVQSASEIIKMFLGRKWKHCYAFLRFLQITRVKTFTRDQFVNVLEFSRTVTTFEDYDENGAWPILLDDFVAHYLEHKDLYFNVSDELESELNFLD